MMKKYSLKPLILAVALLLGSCGANPNSSVRFGPSDTTMAGNKFDLTVIQTVTTAPNIFVQVHVWNASSGAPTFGATVNFGGDIAVPSPYTTDANGLVFLPIKINATIGIIANSVSTGTVTATVDDKTVQGAFQFRPTF